MVHYEKKLDLCSKLLDQLQIMFALHSIQLMESLVHGINFAEGSSISMVLTVCTVLPLFSPPPPSSKSSQA